MTMMTTATAQHSTDVASVLSDLGVEIKKVGEREITGKCPVHIRTTGHHDNNPSWSMNASTGLWICFSCGARGTLPMLISELAGEDVDTLSVQKMLVNTSMNRLLQPKEDTEEVLDVSDFYSFSRVSDKRCYKRALDPDLVWLYGIRWNSETKAWSIPIIGANGLLQGWQEKKAGYVRNYPIGVQKSHTLFGIERYCSKTAVLVESPLDVIRFASVFSKPQALATFGAYVSDRQLSLLTHVADRVIIALDNDKAGIEASQRLYKKMPRPRRGIGWWNYDGTDAKDIGDMSDDEIERGFLTSGSMPPWVRL